MSSSHDKTRIGLYERMTMNNRTNRRTFLKTGALVTASATVLGGNQELDGPAIVARRGRGRFDADVVVVGAGYAGMTAAYRAAQGGAVCHRR